MKKIFQFDFFSYLNGSFFSNFEQKKKDTLHTWHAGRTRLQLLARVLVQAKVRIQNFK